MAHGEVLVIAERGREAEVSTILGERYAVLHRLPPRILVVKVEDRSAATQIGTIPGVASAADERDVSQLFDIELDGKERLFVSAWIQRVQRGAKQRPYDKLDWDSAGLSPPDKPSME